MNKTLKNTEQYNLSNINETLFKMSSTLEFMKQVIIEIRTNQTISNQDGTKTIKFEIKILD